MTASVVKQLGIRRVYSSDLECRYRVTLIAIDAEATKTESSYIHIAVSSTSTGITDGAAPSISD